MCDPISAQTVVQLMKKPTPVVAVPVPATGSRRRRLWDLPAHSHCAVVGVGLPLESLRKLAHKAFGDKLRGSDYAIHSHAVSECRHRNPLSELMQNALEARHGAIIQRFKQAKTAAELLDHWRHAVEQGEPAAAFWAGLTHPRCDEGVQEVLCHDMHMLQHQAGASLQVDIAKLDALLEENTVLARELAKVQERSTRLLAERTRELELAHNQLALASTALVAKDRSIVFLNADLQQLRQAIPELDLRERQQKKIAQLQDRLNHSLAHNQVLKQERSQLLQARPGNTGDAPVKTAAPATPVAAPAERSFPVHVFLRQQTVLCVGGRPGNLASYRDLIERVGGRFAHHDGGVEDSHNLLDSSLSAADLVICQTGCISHNAYWRVKDFCKRTGKRCVFVESPSASALARSLESMTVN